MSPAPGERMLRFVGDRVRFSIKPPDGFPSNARAMLRTNLGKAERLREEIIATHAGKNPMSVAFWRDIPLLRQPSGEWAVELPLTDVGFYRAKAYLLDGHGRQVWPEGADAGISVHPDAYRSANTIYCAFPRMFGPTKKLAKTIDENFEKGLNKLDDQGYVVIPPSGTLRALIGELPYIMETLGCRILQLLPIGPTPTTFARFGRFGSPYACLDLTGIDLALVEFDKKVNGVGQFRELTQAVHHRGGRVLLDIVINHTGWGSRLYENHPEWFVHDADGTFVSPGAWGVTWGDLVELNPNQVELWDGLADAFLIWCRRGVDGFRCDAGYKVPMQVWQYIQARVRREYPEALFLLEGLGGPLEATEALLTDGGMQWAYSELFQNYGAAEVARYLDYSIRQSERVGLFVHYSETHDNERLASKGRKWSLMRNRLCALASASGGYGFTCGVEWLAPERLNVHGSRGLAWGNPKNLVDELARLNRLLASHPCFFDGAKITRLSPEDSAILVLRRDSAEGLDTVLVLVNSDARGSDSVSIKTSDFDCLGSSPVDLLTQKLPVADREKDETVLTLEAGDSFCLARSAKPVGLGGEDYRRARAQSAWAITALSKVLLPEEIGPCPWRDLAARIHSDARGFLGSLADLNRVQSRTDLLGALKGAEGKYPRVFPWSDLDRRRVALIPPGHWLLLQDSKPFSATLRCEKGGSEDHAAAIEVQDGYVAFFPPRNPAQSFDAELELNVYAAEAGNAPATVRFLRASPSYGSVITKPVADAIVLLANGRGGMARLGVDVGHIDSKYDCALGANLNPDFPVDRHVLAKRLRVWVSADGFITALNLQNLASFQAGPPAVWSFVAEAGDGRTVELQMTADMIEGSNTTVFTFARLPGTKPADLPPQFDIRVTVRVDIEDRNFHSETHRNDGADYHFEQNTHAFEGQIGFAFTPAPDRQLRALASAGDFHAEPEWCQGIPHPVEQSRGQVGWGDAYSPGWFDIPLVTGRRATLILSAEIPAPGFDAADGAGGSRLAAEKAALERAKLPVEDSFGRQLVLAAGAFVARRGEGRTVIAGYPWFLDWGRDTFISARGLLSAGMVTEVVDLLVSFGQFVRDGTMPNTIQGGNASNRDTSDAPLWYGVVCQEAAALVGDQLYQTRVDKSGRAITDVLREIAVGYSQGTPNGIRMDPASGLIWSPPHFTWMDTNYPACTPREGYPIEIQVLWILLLRQLHRIGIARANEAWDVLADRAERSLHELFWLEEKGYLADLLIAGPGQPAAGAVRDNALRCNYLFAIAFGFLGGARAQRAVAAAWRHLLVPGGLRTLAPLPVSPPLPIHGADGRLLNNPEQPYWGSYEGDEDTRRKPAYHNGTAWVWMLPTGCEALAKSWDCAPAAVAAARACLGSLEETLLTRCLGQLPEILDGDAPHQSRGCDAQAWSVLEALRVWKWLGQQKGEAAV
ncbi:MAG TPA: amylo-alpha-1,6-glucosidase [Candidatus Baltobacteraceae bacterium]|jgi:predicted glycogen debranching enzyme|nr:amylo-alpha-1,6-glucosidase [Candidatus Baltobacteraceae bacterium]